MPQHRTDDDIRRAFDAVDVDKSGFVDRTEFDRLAKTLDPETTSEDVAKALATLDSNSDQKISYDEFVSWFRGDKGKEMKLLSKARQRLFSYECMVQAGSTQLPLEVVETIDHFNLALDLPGIKLPKDSIKKSFTHTQLGYLLKLDVVVDSAVEPGRDEDPIIRSVVQNPRLLGNISWAAEVHGVFEGRPETNYKHGVLKIRLKKKQQAEEEAAEDVDF